MRFHFHDMHPMSLTGPRLINLPVWRPVVETDGHHLELAWQDERKVRSSASTSKDAPQFLELGRLVSRGQSRTALIEEKKQRAALAFSHPCREHGFWLSVPD